MFKKILILTISMFGLTVLANTSLTDYPLLVIGASYANGSTPFNNGQSPLGGISVNFGSYVSLGQALIRNRQLPGYVINEAEAGATTFSRSWCPTGATICGPAGWDSYETMLNKALSRVALPPTFTEYNAKFVVISMANDCLHSDAFGVPQSETSPCTHEQINQAIDRMIAVGNSAISKGVTPIFEVLPKYQDLDLNLFKSLFGLEWVIDEASFNYLRDQMKSRITNELPQAVILNVWKKFVHIGDGLHPSPHTSKRAAKVIAEYIESQAKK
ncbi:MAG: hypothetical protein KDD45_13585 [Bdellovibrionales bacterium]|nr:hypothetical protein [Bdellovibrionales bacterium]